MISWRQLRNSMAETYRQPCRNKPLVLNKPLSTYCLHTATGLAPWDILVPPLPNQQLDKCISAHDHHQGMGGCRSEKCTSREGELAVYISKVLDKPNAKVKREGEGRRERGDVECGELFCILAPWWRVTLA